MNDKDKLIIVAEVSYDPSVDRLEIAKLSHDAYRMLRDKLDDSIEVITVPNRSLKFPTVQIKTLNTEVITPKELESLLKKSEEIVKSITSNYEL